MDRTMDYEKYLFYVNDSVIAIEAENKDKAIMIFKKEFEKLYSMDWRIQRLLSEITIDGNYKRY